MDEAGAGQLPVEGSRCGRPDGGAARPEGVAAARRDLNRREEAEPGRGREPAQIRVPVEAGRRVLGRVDDRRHRPGRADQLVDRVHRRVSEELRQAEQTEGVEVLLLEEEHLVPVEEVAELDERRTRPQVGEVDAVDDRADRGREARGTEGGIAGDRHGEHGAITGPAATSADRTDVARPFGRSAARPFGRSRVGGRSPYAGAVVATRWRGRSAAVAGLPVAIVGAMVVVDIVIAGTLSSPLAAVVLTDLAVGFWVVFAHRDPGLAASMAALSSIGVSVAVAGVVRVDGYSYPELVTGSWFGFGELVALAYVTAVAVRLVRPPAAVAVVALFGVALAALVRLRHEGTLEDVLAIPMAVGFVGTVAVGLYLRSVDQAREQADLRIRQDERNEIARELHDVVAHHVTGIVLQAQAAQLVSDERPEVAAEALATIEGAGSEALRSMRAMVGTLRSDQLAHPAPTARVDDLRAMASAHPGEVPVHVSIDDDVPASLRPSWRRSTASPGRRSPTCAATPAMPTRIDLVVARHGDGSISVADDGAPVRAGAGPGGLRARRHGRAGRALGGTLHAGPCETGGWECGRLPVAAAMSDRCGSLIADDQAMVRSGLRLILESTASTSSAEAVDGRKAIDLARRLRPDVCLLDIRMPGTRRARGDPPARRPRRRGPDRRRRRDDLRPRRVRAPRPSPTARAASSSRTPALRCWSRPCGPPRSATPSSPPRSPSAFLRHFSADEPDEPAGGVDLTPREEDLVRAVARGRTTRRSAPSSSSPSHGQDPPRQPPAQARRPQPGRARGLGLATGRIRRRS